MARKGSMTRRIALAGMVWMPPAGAVVSDGEADERSFRYRAETLDALLRRAKEARSAQRITFSAYEAFIDLLRAEETQLHSEAAKREFKDLTESNYWRRSRLKFPSGLEMEVRLTREGRDPAYPQ
jgi:hypothetical protein